MVDFSRAEGSKNHKSSFDRASNILIDTIQQTQSTYHTTWSELEIMRKDRAAIIESTIQLLKNNKIKLTKQLGRCKNPEINEELLKVINELPFEVKEEIQCNLIKINNRYEKIAELGRKLEELSETLANYRILEADYDEEVEIDLSLLAKKAPTPTPEESVIVDESLEKVVEIRQASEELQQDLDRTLELMRKVTSTEIQTDSEENLTNDEVSYDTEEISSVFDEINEITSETESQTDEESIDSYLNGESTLEEVTNEEYVLFTINDKLTLKDIAENVYGESRFWKELYNYSTNKSKIDKKASEYKTTAETVASQVGYLENVTLQFPVELVTIEEIPASEYEQTKKGRRLAA